MIKPGISEFNPLLKVRRHTVAGKRMTVIRDDLLPAGTKGRYLPLFLNQKKYSGVNEFIYAGSSSGYGQVGMAYSAKLLGKKSTIFIQRFEEGESEQMALAKKYGAVLKGPYQISISDLKKKANSYIKASPKKRAWGLATDSRSTAAVSMLSDQIRIAFEKSRPLKKLLQKKPGKIFVTAGTAIIYTALKGVFPDTKFVVVQVGKTIWPDQLFPGDILYKSKYKFTEIPEPDKRPSYPASDNYDAKNFDAVAELADDDDWIWNIAG